MIFVSVRSRSAQPKPPILLTHEQAAELLGVDSATLYRWRKRGLIAYRKQGRWIRYTAEDIEEFINSSRRKSRKP